MKFQLFGRLRDNQDESESSTQQKESDFNNQDNLSDFGGGLQRTVENLFDQGYSEEEVRKELQGQYSRDEIQGAINQAVKTSATTQQQEGPEPMTPYQEENNDLSPMDEGFDKNDNENNDLGDQGMQQQEMNPQPNPPMNQGQQPMNQQSSGAAGDVEELIETIVAENFERVENEFENVYSEIDEMKEQLDDMENRMHDLEVRDDEDETQVIQKMDDLEQDINEYQSRIGGLEKAFQQVLPSLVDNVRDLTQLVQEIKQERGIETSSNVDQEDIDDIDMEEW
jgi:hypothetical protein